MNVWLDDIMQAVGPDRHAAWHALGAVLRALRDRLPLEVTVHLGAQLLLLVRGLCYDQWHLAAQLEQPYSLDAFLARVSEGLEGTRPMNVRDVTFVVLRTLAHHIDPREVQKVAATLPEAIRAFWRGDEQAAASDGRRLSGGGATT